MSWLCSVISWSRKYLENSNYSCITEAGRGLAAEISELFHIIKGQSQSWLVILDTVHRGELLCCVHFVTLVTKHR